MNRLKKISILTIAALLAASFAFADEIGRFISVEGKVDLLKAGRTEAVGVAADEAVSSGDIVRTKSQSKAEIRFTDNSSLKIGENSRVQIKEYSVENGKRTRGAILLERGSMRATVSKTSAKNDFIIDTPNAAGSAKGTDLFIVFQKSATSVLVVNGKFSVANLAFPDKVVDITSGNTALIPADEQPQAPREYLALEKSNYEISTEPTVRKALALKKEVSKEAAAEGYSSPGEIGAKVTAVSGSVRIKSRGSIIWHDAKANELLNAGDTIETKENGKIGIKLDNGNVIDLKPDSQLALQELTQDQKSGEYQNLFESKYGKLRAKVGKLKGNSRFEIKTPTAVAAVRGTVMYLNILPGLTSAYFEEGNGFVTNTISGDSRVVPDGSSSTSDNRGNVSNPAPESESGGSGWHEGWDSGVGAEGYSAPEGGTASDAGDRGGNNSNTDNTANTTFDKVPVTETDPTTLGKTTTTTSTTFETTKTTTSTTFETTKFSWSAKIDAAYRYGYDEGDGVDLDYYNNSHYGTISAAESPFTSASLNARGNPVDITLTGKTYPNHYISWWGSLNANKAGAGGAIPYGFIAGATTDTSIKKSVEGRLVSLYIDSSGKAGTLSGDFGDKKTYDAYYSNINDMWKATGAMTATQRADGYDPTNYKTGAYNIDGYLRGNFISGGGEIYNNYSIVDIAYNRGEGYLGTYTKWLVKDGTTPEPWGIYNIELGGYYNDNISNDWTLTMGGTSWRGLSSTEYWIATVTGNKWSDQRIVGTLAGKYITKIALGDITGDLLGSYDTDSNYVWEAIALGTFTETPLKLSGLWGDGNITHSYFDGELIQDAGYEKGLIGSTDPSWGVNGHKFDYIAMGRYSDTASLTSSQPFLLQTPLQSWNTKENNYTTLDGGAFSGRGIAVWNNGTLDKGRVAAIYLSKTATGGLYNAGIMTSVDLTGKFYRDPMLSDDQEVGMWEGTGTMTPVQYAQVMITDPSVFNDLSRLINKDDNLFAMGYGTKDFEEMFGIATGTEYNIRGQNWGMWQMTAIGSAPTNEATDWRLALGGNLNAQTYFLGTVVGSGWSNNQLEGEFKGVKFTPYVDGSITGFNAGSMTGHVAGTYVDGVDTTWHAAGVGEWVDLAQLTTSALQFNNTVLADMVSVPITETYSNLLTGSGTFGAGGAINASMDISMYAKAATDSSGIWAALISGTYSGRTGGAWSVNLNKGNDTATLTGTQWDSNGKWLANVSGTVNSATIAGQAGGTYANGALTGVGAGTWK